MKTIFNSISLKQPPSSVFDLTHDVKMSANMGKLIPTLVLECLPGDKFELGCETLIRFAPMVAPVMHRMDVTMHYFFCPNRIVWENWEKYITDRNSGYVLPYVNYQGFTAAQKKFADYMGVPPNDGLLDQKINVLPFAAYQKIYNEYYRDENLIAPVDSDLASGSNQAKAGILFAQRYRAWEHDYFTSSLPFAQKGSAVDIPLGEVSLNPTWGADGNHPVFKRPDLTAQIGALSNTPGVYPGGDDGITAASGAGTGLAYDPDGSLEVQPTTINDLRRAFRLQEWLEKNARGGTRYIESILSHFGVRSSDKRLQRPEYITGVKTPVVISEVLNSTGTDDLPQGNMAGHGVSVSSGRSGSYFCEEHGYIIGIMSVMPKTAYQQGIPKTYIKDDPLDFAWPTFATIGEQEVLLKELYAYTSGGDDVFGYVPRYAEYKYMPSRVAGDFRTTLDYWHLGRIFGTVPALNQAFIECNPDATQRIFADIDPSDDKLYCHILHKIRARRKLPFFGTPAGI